MSTINASSAKLVGIGTVTAAILIIGQWGVLSALFIASAGGILAAGAGDSLSRLSIRNLVLFIGYWGLLMLGIGIGAG